MEKELRLLKREDFNKIYKYGKSSANKHFVLYFLPQAKVLNFHVGFSVSKKLGNAVVRNRIRRMLKEIIRLHKKGFKKKTSFIVVVRNQASGLSYHDMEKSIIHLFQKSSHYFKYLDLP
jgi:ribonuclease P protein component